jgi:hypothetical protein
MSNAVQLSDVQLLNLSVLLTLQASIEGSRGRLLHSISRASRRAALKAWPNSSVIVANRAESLFTRRSGHARALRAPGLSTVRLAETAPTSPTR